MQVNVCNGPAKEAVRVWCKHTTIFHVVSMENDHGPDHLRLLLFYEMQRAKVELPLKTSITLVIGDESGRSATKRLVKRPNLCADVRRPHGRRREARDR